MKEKETEARFRLPFWCQRDGRRRQAKVSARRQRQASSLEPHIDINRETERDREGAAADVSLTQRSACDPLTQSPVQSSSRSQRRGAGMQSGRREEGASGTQPACHLICADRNTGFARVSERVSESQAANLNPGWHLQQQRQQHVRSFSSPVD